MGCSYHYSLLRISVWRMGLSCTDIYGWSEYCTFDETGSWVICLFVISLCRHFKSRNWVADPWLEYVYLRYRGPLPSELALLVSSGCACSVCVCVCVCVLRACVCAFSKATPSLGSVELSQSVIQLTTHLWTLTSIGGIGRRPKCSGPTVTTPKVRP